VAPRALPHLPVLDGYRGLAALAVVLFHLRFVSGGRAADALEQVLTFGWIGVDLFFVLSGFLITGILLETRGAAGWVRRFLVRRALRILPLFYVTMIVAGVLVPAVSPRLLQPLVPREWPWFMAHLANWRYALPSAAPQTLIHFWSVAIEEQFYLVWPFAVAMLTRRRLGALAATLAVGALAIRVGASAMGWGGRWMYYVTPTHLDGLAVGAWLAVRSREPAGLTGLVAAARWCAALAALGLVAAARRAGNAEFADVPMREVGYSLAALGSGAVLVLGLAGDPRGWAARVGSTPWLRHVGRYTYAIYLLHYPIVRVCRAMRLTPDALPHIGGSQIPAWCALTAFVIAASYTLARLTWLTIESPFLRLKARWG
jgi:peptidoglycan/LPS O-acetylase OafA/YrhL